MSTLARDYVMLAFAIERHLPGYIDAYFGPEEVKAEAESRPKQPLAILSSEVEHLMRSLAAASFETQRTDFLSAQLVAMRTTIRLLQGERLPLAQEVKLLFGLEPAWVDEATFAEAHRQLAECLPPGESLTERLAAYKKSAQVSVATALPLLEGLRDRLQTLTHQRFSMPIEESFELVMVSGQPWGAYNWFLGQGRSRVEINTDLPLRATSFLSMIAHEGYPGHHTELTLKEIRLLQEHTWQEHGLTLINSPSCAIAEGIANCALDTLLTSDEQIAWEQELFDRASLPLDATRALQIRKALKPLGGVVGNAAFMMYDQGASPDETIAYLQRWALSDPAEARKSIEFISGPLSRSYTFNYTFGMDLLEELFAIQGRRQTWFTRLLTEPVTPAMVHRWIGRP